MGLPLVQAIMLLVGFLSLKIWTEPVRAPQLHEVSRGGLTQRDGGDATGPTEPGQVSTPKSSSARRFDGGAQFELGLLAGQPTTDLPVSSLYFPKQLDRTIVATLFILYPDCSDTERSLILDTTAAIAPADLELRRSLLPDLWDACAISTSRMEPSVDRRVAQLQTLQRRHRSAVRELLGHETAALVAGLSKELAPDRANQIGYRLRTVRMLDQDRLAGVLLPMARVDVLSLVQAFMEAGNHDGPDASLPSPFAATEPLMQDLESAYIVWERARDEAAVADERFRSGLESLPPPTPETGDVIAAARAELGIARRSVLSRLADAEARVASQRAQFFEILRHALPVDEQEDLHSRLLVGAYGPAVVDPWDLRPLLRVAHQEMEEEDVAGPILTSIEQSVRQTERLVCKALDSYWLERLRSFARSEDANVQCTAQVRGAYDASRAIASPLAESIFHRLKVDSRATPADRFEQWIVECESLQAHNLTQLGLWGEKRSRQRR